jgi:hypothetical protein
VGEESYHVCGNDLMWGNTIPCPAGELCYDGDCYDPCFFSEIFASSMGCSFLANRMDNVFDEFDDPDNPELDSIVVGNTSSAYSVEATFYFTANGGNNEQQVEQVNIAPLGTYEFTLDNPSIESVSLLRAGGSYRVATDRPVVAYQHSPLDGANTNDSSMLLPENVLTGNYIVASYPGTFPVAPELFSSYFQAVATTDSTIFQWTPPVDTAGGVGVLAVNGGATGQALMNRHDTINVTVATNHTDLSGTIIEADEPVWVVGANECANVPDFNGGQYTFCDHLQEVMIPLEYWGVEYVGAHAPNRGSEEYHWRVYAGDDAVTINTSPQQAGFPVVLDKGEFHQFSTQESFVFTGDAAFMPVQYLECNNPNAGLGDPAMYQMVPSEQFLDTYVFVTGTSYTTHYAQVIRAAGSADVTVDGVTVTGYYTVGAFEIADWEIAEGSHVATSDDPFGIVQVGYRPATSYAYPGGMQLAVINPQ